jgi:cytochrome oxidase Cu insertion factor (SCO1/SenC/PrrC family)
MLHHLPALSCLLPRRRAFVLLCCLGLLVAGLPATPVHAQSGPRLKAPDFDGAVGPTLGSDKPIRLKDLRGKIVIVEFWTLC